MICLDAFSCSLPNIPNAYILDNKTYYNKAIPVFCKEGYIFNDRKPHWAICVFNEVTRKEEWANLEKIKCIPNSCNPHPDFDLVKLQEKKEYYNIGELVEYTCPNGYIITIKCGINKATGIGDWDFKGNCKGIDFSRHMASIVKLFDTSLTYLRFSTFCIFSINRKDNCIWIASPYQKLGIALHWRSDGAGSIHRNSTEV